MNKMYAYAAGTLLAVSSLASCSSSQYAFKAGALPYHEAVVRKQTASVPVQPEATPVVALSTVTATAQPVAQPAVQSVQNTPAPEMATAPKRLNTVQRAIANAVTKRVDTSLRQHHDTAKRRRGGISRAGRAGLFIAAGLVLMLIAVLTGLGIFGSVGALAFLTGLVLLVIALIKGNR